MLLMAEMLRAQRPRPPVAPGWLCGRRSGGQAVRREPAASRSQTAAGQRPRPCRGGHWSFGGRAAWIPCPHLAQCLGRGGKGGDGCQLWSRCGLCWHLTPNNLEVAAASLFYRGCSRGPERTVLWATHQPAPVPDGSRPAEHTRLTWPRVNRPCGCRCPSPKPTPSF